LADLAALVTALEPLLWVEPTAAGHVVAAVTAEKAAVTGAARSSRKSVQLRTAAAHVQGLLSLVTLTGGRVASGAYPLARIAAAARIAGCAFQGCAATTNLEQRVVLFAPIVGVSIAIGESAETGLDLADTL
jgi:hypothetical protein